MSDVSTNAFYARFLDRTRPFMARIYGQLRTCVNQLEPRYSRTETSHEEATDAMFRAMRTELDFSAKLLLTRVGGDYGAFAAAMKRGVRVELEELLEQRYADMMGTKALALFVAANGLFDASADKKPRAPRAEIRKSKKRA